MFFLNTTYLWGFLGLAVPIAIHLWSKKEGRTIKMGSIKLLQEADSKKSSSIRINEWWLLLLRMLIISLLVLILAEPQVKREVHEIPILYLVEPSLLSNNEIRSVIDSIDSDVSIRLLQKGFPELEEFGLTDSETPSYWQLAKEMEELPADSIVVFSNAFLSGIKGMRPEVNKKINWIVLDPESSIREVVQVKKKEDEVEVVTLVSDHQRLDYEKEIVSINSSGIEIHPTEDSIKILSDTKNKWMPLKVENPIEVLMYYDDNLEDESKYIESSLDAIAKFLQRPVEVVKVQDVDSLKNRTADMRVWLSNEPAVETNAPLLLFKPDSLASELIAVGTSNNTFHLTRSLNVENIVEGYLPERLLEILDLYPDLAEAIKSNDRRVMSREELLPKESLLENDKKYSKLLNFSAWLWLLLMAALVTERIIAHYRKQ